MRITLLALMTLICGCAALPQGAGERPTHSQSWQRTELYFSIGADEARWRAFLDREVTPRFPDGLSVIEVQGQWRDAGAIKPKHERSRLLVLLHPATADNNSAIEQIRSAWKVLTHDASVLRVDQPAQVSF